MKKYYVKAHVHPDKDLESYIFDNLEDAKEALEDFQYDIESTEEEYYREEHGVEAPLDTIFGDREFKMYLDGDYLLEHATIEEIEE